MQSVGNETSRVNLQTTRQGSPYGCQQAVHLKVHQGKHHPQDPKVPYEHQASTTKSSGTVIISTGFSRITSGTVIITLLDDRGQAAERLSSPPSQPVQPQSVATRDGHRRLTPSPAQGRSGGTLGRPGGMQVADLMVTSPSSPYGHVTPTPDGHTERTPQNTANTNRTQQSAKPTPPSHQPPTMRYATRQHEPTSSPPTQNPAHRQPPQQPPAQPPRDEPPPATPPASPVSTEQQSQKPPPRPTTHPHHHRSGVCYRKHAPVDRGAGKLQS
ncbi:hypothetical protein BDK51DRAFT_47658 [Blyttiomyces helicus]|uniref:Uncharacterized protein n=1 Tax=Blyttiomyces helicus TaxID=388810 RepID=A0A4P9WJ01_9FUNG|nr:hypothetical protein BDK51DRAFT_47658 [Blyttiomyces helicus]|eukprot:RKO92794.1 hypothetical protein BDK51DRAFT_47658 [Blyttiomyces helicus]